MTTTEGIEHDVQLLDRVTIRFAGDSGDGMQLTGTQFTRTAAVFGNDISTFPDYPAEIRAPAGSLPGVSGFQISFSASDIHTPGDAPDVLVAMNPAALKTNVMDLPAGGAIIVNSDAFTPGNLGKAAYASNPLADGSLKQYKVFEVPISTLNANALEGLDMTSKQMDLTKNFFALGLMFWLYERSMEPTIAWIDEKFGAPPGHRRGQPPGPLRRLRLRRDDRDVPHDLPGSEGEAAARAPTGTSPATRRPPWASSRPRRPRSATCSTAPTRSPPPRTSSSSSPATSRSAFGPSRPRTRSPRSAPPSARPTAARSR